ncbi:MAG TPA: hypothetical protein VGH70_14995 [Bradyrhizobium sp.]
MALEIGVVRATVRENIGNSMAHGFADAQLPLRSAARGIVLLVMTRHRYLSKSPVPAPRTGNDVVAVSSE